MSTTLAKVKRNGPTTEAALDALLIARQWGYADDTRRITVMQSDGVTLRRFWDATRLADQTATYGTALIGTQGITGVTPSGGASGDPATLQAMLTGLATASTGYIFNGTGVQASSNFNISGSGVIGTNLTISSIATGRIPYTTTAGLLTSGTGLTYNGSAFSVTGTGAISGILTLASNLGFTNASDITIPDNQGAALTITEAGNPYLRFITTNGSESIALSKAVTMSSTLGVTGAQTNSAALTFDGNGSSAAGTIWKSAAGGLNFRGATGSTSDLQILSASSGSLLTNPTGTNNIELAASGGVVKVGTGTPSFSTKRLTVIGNSFDNTALQLENTDVTLDADGRQFNLGVTDVSGTEGRLDLTQPGVRTVLSVFKGGNVGIGSTTDGGAKFQVTGSATMSSTLGVTGATTLTGNVGVGGGPATSSGLDITSSGMTGTTQFGLSSGPTFGTGATTAGYAGYFKLTNSGSFTMGTGAGLFIVGPTLGASTVTNLIGLDIASQTGGTNNYAIRTGASGLVQLGSLTASSAVATDASKNLISVTNTGTGNNVLSASPTLTGTINAASQTLSGTLGVTGVSAFGGTGTVSSIAMYIGGGFTSTQGSGTTQQGLVVSSVSGTDATSTYYCQYNQAKANASLTNLYGINIASSTNTGTTTNNYGLNIQNQTIGTNNWAIKTGTGLVEFGDTVQKTTSGEFLIRNTNGVGGSTGGVRLYTSSGDIKLEAVGGVNLTGSTGITVTGNTDITGTLTVSSTLAANGVINSAAGIQLSGNIASAAGKITSSTNDGVVIQGKTGSVYDFAIIKASSGYALTMDTGTSNFYMYGGLTVNNALSIGGLTTFAVGTATTAGGALAAKFGSSGVTGLYFGSGAPTITAPQGSLYLRTDGSSTSTRAYINTTGSTTWTAITTAA